MEGLVDGVEHVVDVGLQDTSLVIVCRSDVALNDVGVGGAELSGMVRSLSRKRLGEDTHEVEAAIAHLFSFQISMVMMLMNESAYGIGVNNIVAVLVVSSRANGVGTANISRDIGHDGETSGRSATEPVGSKCLVAEDGSHSIGRKLGGGSVGEELEDESDLRESGEDTSHVELEFLVLLLILVESVELEFLEGLVVDNRVVAFRSAVTETADVVEESVEEVILEVNAVANVIVPAGRRHIT